MKNEKRIAIKFMVKPEVCPQCGGRVVDILYGEPTPEAMEAMARGKLMLGGCIVREDAPEWQCVKCGQHYKQD